VYLRRGVPVVIHCQLCKRNPCIRNNDLHHACMGAASGSAVSCVTTPITALYGFFSVPGAILQSREWRQRDRHASPGVNHTDLMPRILRLRHGATTA
jgi:hypothetical protein